MKNKGYANFGGGQIRDIMGNVQVANRPFARWCHFTKNEKSKDYCEADFKQRVLLFITIFRLAIPAFFRFTDVTELM